MKRLAILLLVILVACQKGPEPDHALTLMLKPAESVNYDIELNHSIIKSGVLERTWNKVTVPNKEGLYSIYYNNERYYINILEFNHINSISNVTITHELPLIDKKGNLTIFSDHPLERNKTQNIWITIKGTAKNMIYCF